MKAQAVRRSALFMRVRAWGRAVDPSPHFVAALCSVALFVAVYTLAVVFLGSAP